MTQKVIINEVSIDATSFYEDTVQNKAGDNSRRKIGFDFKVTSSDYHEITTLLYANDFIVEVPEKDLKFQATIQSYSTSITNLYEENAVGDFKLELIEKA
jgi:hypothetical protein